MGVGICQARLGQEQSGTVIDTTGTSEVVHGAQTGRQVGTAGAGTVAARTYSCRSIIPGHRMAA